MVKHNNVVPNAHFHKYWQRYVRTWFDQPARHARRQLLRKKKAARLAPRPVKNLRPVVHAPTQRYNMKVRAGRGFTLEELKEAGLGVGEARSIGIAVDHRRRNKSVQSLQANVQRLREYKSKLIIFPRHINKPKAGDSSPEEIAQATQLKGEILPIKNVVPAVEFHTVTEELKKRQVFKTLRSSRANAKNVGKRLKKKE